MIANVRSRTPDGRNPCDDLMAHALVRSPNDGILARGVGMFSCGPRRPNTNSSQPLK